MKAIAHVLLSALVLTACHGRELTQPEPDPEPTHRLEMVSGDRQADTVARRVDSLLVVRLLDAAGQPVVGAAVTWRVVAGEGEVYPTSETTGGDGISRAEYVLGALAGVQSVAAQASELGGPAVFFTLHSTADAPAVLARRGEEIQAGDIDRPLASALEVRLGDQIWKPDCRRHHRLVGRTRGVPGAPHERHGSQRRRLRGRNARRRVRHAPGDRNLSRRPDSPG